MEQNKIHHTSLSSLTSTNDKRLKPFAQLFMEQANLHTTTIIPNDTLQQFNSPSVLLNDFGPASSDPEIKSRPLSSSLSRISVSPCSFHRRLALFYKLHHLFNI
uniref:Ovule protein n=1 Tax=Loa loa TaxID=7209 RepID=A0A1I7VIV6_LOALO